MLFSIEYLTMTMNLNKRDKWKKENETVKFTYCDCHKRRKM